MPRKSWQTRDSTYCVATSARALHAVVDANHRRTDLPVVAREIFDFGGTDPTDRRDALRIKFLRAFFEPAITQRVALNVVAIEPPLAHQHMHHAESKGGVGTRHQRN